MKNLKLFAVPTINDRLKAIAHVHWGPDGLNEPGCWCKDDECSICSVLLCPWLEPFHLHHDGCPACVQAGNIDQIDWQEYYKP